MRKVNHLVLIGDVRDISVLELLIKLLILCFLLVKLLNFCSHFPQRDDGMGEYSPPRKATHLILVVLIVVGGVRPQSVEIMVRLVEKIHNED